MFQKVHFLGNLKFNSIFFTKWESNRAIVSFSIEFSMKTKIGFIPILFPSQQESL